MHPWKIQYHICWCILCGYLWAYVLSHSWGRAIEHVPNSEGVLDHHLSLSSGGNQAKAIKRFQKLRFSSDVEDFATCGDLDGVGSFDTTCLLSSNVYRNTDIYVVGAGNLEILPNVEILCPIEDCTISFNLSGNTKVGQNTTIVAGTVVFSAASLTMGHNSSLNTSSLGGSPPPQTSGTPVGYDGAGGGHGGRGASCFKTNLTNFWGGDVYGWSTLSYPWGYGSKGGGTSDNHKFGGSGGGRVLLDVNNVLYINGSVSAEGGNGGSLGGGGSGGSIIVHAQKL
ncbi:hypothetical protein PHJA_002058900 [Phtheirospermum japonicum]|uniref:Uncharacterized protein n=1 Tax=Phtheirospermum japonicum TaxID=374723 RepID=A0A830CHH4_9LAMI|nr:hypothetical protein PHJA_002058900 [Phtheirospermum japonicum]